MSKKLIEVYDNATVRSLVQLIPLGIGSAVDSLMDKIIEKRRRIFFDELQKNNEILHPELLQNEDFIHFFMITHEIVLRTKRKEKIELLGKLLIDFIDQGIKDNDRHEEILEQIEKLKYNDILFLSEIEKLEGTIKEYDREKGDGFFIYLDDYSKKWPKFQEEMAKKYNMSMEDVKITIIRLVRLGLIVNSFSISSNSLNNTIRMTGLLTPIYFEIKKIVEKS